MESNTKFNLTEQVNLWKKSLLQTEAISKDNITELEDHLWSEIQSLNSSGLNNQEAFFIAKHRLGTSSILETEYKKSDPQTYTSKKIGPVFSGIISFLLIINLSELLTRLIGLTGYNLNLNYLAIIIIASLSLSTIFMYLLIDNQVFFKLSSSINKHIILYFLVTIGAYYGSSYLMQQLMSLNIFNPLMIITIIFKFGLILLFFIKIVINNQKTKKQSKKMITT